MSKLTQVQKQQLKDLVIDATTTRLTALEMVAYVHNKMGVSMLETLLKAAATSNILYQNQILMKTKKFFSHPSVTMTFTRFSNNDIEQCNSELYTPISNENDNGNTEVQMLIL